MESRLYSEVLFRKHSLCYFHLRKANDITGDFLVVEHAGSNFVLHCLDGCESGVLFVKEQAALGGRSSYSELFVHEPFCVDTGGDFYLADKVADGGIRRDHEMLADMLA